MFNPAARYGQGAGGDSAERDIWDERGSERHLPNRVFAQLRNALESKLGTDDVVDIEGTFRLRTSRCGSWSVQELGVKLGLDDLAIMMKIIQGHRLTFNYTYIQATRTFQVGG